MQQCTTSQVRFASGTFCHDVCFVRRCVRDVGRGKNAPFRDNRNSLTGHVCPIRATRKHEFTQFVMDIAFVRQDTNSDRAPRLALDR